MTEGVARFDVPDIAMVTVLVDGAVHVYPICDAAGSTKRIAIAQ